MNVFVFKIKKTAVALIILSAVGCACVYAALGNAEKTDGIPCPIVMYHSILRNKLRAGDYIATEEQFISDLDYLAKNGYSPVTVSDLIAYVYDDKPLPEKPVMITFDDGFYNNRAYVYPEIVRRGVPIVISVVGSYIKASDESGDINPAYSYLCRSDIREMEKSGLVEFQNHSFALHTIGGGEIASMKHKGESTEAYRKRLCSDLEKVQRLVFEETGRLPTAFTYPFGKISSESLQIVKDMGFLSSLSCCEGMNYITKSEDCLYQLKRYNRPAKYSTEAFMKRLLTP